jgi:hypothetical protein
MATWADAIALGKALPDQAPVRLRREHEQRIVAEIAASKDPSTGGSVRNVQ